MERPNQNLVNRITSESQAEEPQEASFNKEPPLATTNIQPSPFTSTSNPIMDWQAFVQGPRIVPDQYGNLLQPGPSTHQGFSYEASNSHPLPGQQSHNPFYDNGQWTAEIPSSQYDYLIQGSNNDYADGYEGYTLMDPQFISHASTAYAAQ